MKNPDFWNICGSKSIRQKVAEFLSFNPHLSHFEGTKYFELEDAIVDFIETNRDLISDECEKEYRRDDVRSFVETKYGDAGLKIFDTFPISKIDSIIKNWMEHLSNYDSYCEDYTDALADVMSTVNELQTINKE